ncbi:reticulon-like protein B8 [Hordeum vulgare]|nr:reticulon-like protein B8 [Hordeum vulgare]
MPEHSENATENMMSGIMDAIADKLPKQKSVRFDIDDQGSISGQAKKLFGGHKSVHHILGGGKCLDLLYLLGIFIFATYNFYLPLINRTRSC